MENATPTSGAASSFLFVFPAYAAGSLLRVACDDDNTGAEVFTPVNTTPHETVTSLDPCSLPLGCF
jgi:hypothetical protein